MMKALKLNAPSTLNSHFFFFFKFVEITEIFDFYPYPRGKNASSSELSAVGKGSFLSCFSPIWLLSVVKLFVMGDLFL